jgi:CspA family cold shock protein
MLTWAFTLLFGRRFVMPEGKVKWFNPRKGYGFIATPDGEDIFVHYASITGDGYRTLVEGEPVSFELTKGEKGPRAENVQQINNGNSAETAETAETEEA